MEYKSDWDGKTLFQHFKLKETKEKYHQVTKAKVVITSWQINDPNGERLGTLRRTVETRPLMSKRIWKFRFKHNERNPEESVGLDPLMKKVAGILNLLGGFRLWPDPYIERRERKEWVKSLSRT